MLLIILCWMCNIRPQKSWKKITFNVQLLRNYNDLNYAKVTPMYSCICWDKIFF